MSLNGRDIDNTAPFSSGLRGASSSASPTVTLYGNGIDVEGYGVGTKVSNIFFNNCTGLQNVRSGFWVFDNVNPTAVGFAPRGNIIFDTCVSDPGIGIPSGEPAFYVAGEPANELLGKIYDSVSITNSYLNGGAIVRATDGVLIGNNTIDAGATAVMLFTNSTRVDVQSNNVYKAFAPQNIDEGGWLLSYVNAAQVSASQALPATTAVPIIFDAVYDDHAGEWDGSTTFTVKYPGVYTVDVTLGLDTVASNVDVSIEYGGVSVALVTRRLFSADVAFRAFNGNATLYLKKGDTIRIIGYSTSGAASTINNRTWTTLNIGRIQ
jgi:hypothetical protein